MAQRCYNKSSLPFLQKFLQHKYVVTPIDRIDHILFLAVCGSVRSCLRCVESCRIVQFCYDRRLGFLVGTKMLQQKLAAFLTAQHYDAHIVTSIDKDRSHSLALFATLFGALLFFWRTTFLSRLVVRNSDTIVDSVFLTQGYINKSSLSIAT